MSKASWDPAGLARAQVLDGDEPGLQALARGSAPRWRRQARPAGAGQGRSAGSGRVRLRGQRRAAWSIAATAPGFSRCAPRSPPTPAPAWSARRKAALVPGDRGAASVRPDQPQAAGGVFRSEDQGLRWSYDAQVALGAPNGARCSSARRARWRWNHERATSGCSIPRMARGAGRRRPSWSRWPDAGAYGKAFDAQAERTRGLGQADRLAYRWSLYPLGETQAVGWSWRVRVKTGTDAPQLIETRRFEIAFQDGAPPAFRIQQAAAPAPFQDAFAAPGRTPAVRCARRRAARYISWTRRPGNGMAWPPRLLRARPAVSAGPGSGARAGWCWPAPSFCSRPTAAPAPISIPVTRAATGGRSSCRPARKTDCSAWTRPARAC